MATSSEQLDFLRMLLGKFQEKIDQKDSLEKLIEERCRVLSTEGVASIRKARLDQANNKRLLKEKMTELDRKVKEEREKSNNLKTRTEENKKARDEKIQALKTAINECKEKQERMNQQRNGLIELFNKSIHNDALISQRNLDIVNKKDATQKRSLAVKNGDNILMLLERKENIESMIKDETISEEGTKQLPIGNEMMDLA
ncbi:unnamed protein product, partial [Mesorhabditis belari]|uniref:Uncharacterized protein n=1 Tax=Mesorhabditis belari TaxID=2138241 RepID=A0AAF3EG94_9BILA